MNDFNFFNAYKPQKIKKSKGVQITNFIFLLGVLIIISIIAMNFIAMMSAEAEQIALDSAISNIRLSEEYLRALEKKNINDELKKLVNSLEYIGEETISESYISENMLSVLSDTMPRDLSLSSYSIVNNELIISGTAIEKPAIAEYESRLRQASFVEDLMIYTISKDEEGLYKFVLMIEMGGGIEDENQQS